MRPQHLRPARRTVGLTLLVSALLVIASLPALASHPEATPAGEPWGVHLSFTDDPRTTLTVTWFTDGTEDPGSTVEYGSSPDDLDRSAPGTAQPNPESGQSLIHTAVMTGLQPGAAVFYRVGGSSGFAPVYETQTAPEPGQAVRVAAFADQGVNPTAELVTQAMLDEEVDLLLAAGDLSAAGAEWWDWDAWFQQNEELLATVPLMSAMGEQEGFGPFGASSYLDRVNLPGEERYYSFDYGPIHTLVLQSSLVQAADQGALDEMIAFAEADLAAAADRRAQGEITFTVVLQHHPLYTNHEDEERRIHPALVAWGEQLFDRHAVDLVLTGHDHHYERSNPMVATLPTAFSTSTYEDPVGWIQVITGGGGERLDGFQHRDDFWVHSAAWAQAHHYSLLEADATTLTFEAKQPDPQAPPLDSFTLQAGT